MNKKILCFSIIFLICICLFNICHATDFVTSINDNRNLNNISDSTIDNTIYLPEEDTTTIGGTEISDPVDTQISTTTTTEYESEAELSVSNMINIILIVVGVVLIFLGIAIIIKLK